MAMWKSPAAYYEAPPEYLGREVWVRWDSRCVRIFNDRLEQVQIHQRVEPGKFELWVGRDSSDGTLKADFELAEK